MADHTDREHLNTTTTTTTTSGGASGMAFIVGILVVVVAFIAWFLFAGGEAPDSAAGAADVNVTIESAGDGAETALEGAAEEVTDSQ